METYGIAINVFATVHVYSCSKLREAPEVVSADAQSANSKRERRKRSFLTAYTSLVHGNNVRFYKGSVPSGPINNYPRCRLDFGTVN